MPLLVRCPAMLYAALFAVLQFADPSNASTTSWFSVFEGDEHLEVREVEAPRMVSGAAAPAVSQLLALTSGAFFVYETLLGTGRQYPVILDGVSGDAVVVPDTAWEGRRIEAAVAVGSALYWGTDFSLMEVVDGRAQPFTKFGDLMDFKVMAPPPVPHFGAVAHLAADGTGSVWVHSSGHSRSIVFYTSADRWLTTYHGKPLPQPYPVGRPWRVPAETIAGDPSRPGLWAYGRTRDGDGSVFYCDLALPGDPWEEAFPPPRVAYPRADTAMGLRLWHTRTAVPDGVQPPQLVRPLIAADITGRCWLAEGAEGAASIHVFDGQAFTVVTPPPELLRGSQLRQLVCHNARGELLVATSGAGVLVFDGTQWAEHPLTPLLPTVEGTETRPADRIAVAEGSSVWVATASYLLHWTRDDEQQ